ncbi:MAG: hypothetical protein K2X93_04115 [Candidatus Obscuribacterales bacterium]|nr:hypothetical protein [Candidatus Obscuribacterales bacterium]
MTRLDASDAGSFSPSAFRADEPLPQFLCEKSTSHWNGLIQELKKSNNANSTDNATTNSNEAVPSNQTDKSNSNRPNSTAAVAAKGKTNGEYQVTYEKPEPERGADEPKKDKGQEEKNEKKENSFSDRMKMKRPLTPGPELPPLLYAPEDSENKDTLTPEQREKRDNESLLRFQHEMDKRTLQLQQLKTRTTEQQAELNALLEFPDARDTEVRYIAQYWALYGIRPADTGNFNRSITLEDVHLLESHRAFPRPNSPAAKSLGLGVDDYTDATAKKLRECHQKLAAKQQLSKEEQALYDAWTEFPPTLPNDVPKDGEAKVSFGRKPIFKNAKEGMEIREIARQEKLQKRIPDNEFIKLQAWRAFPTNEEARKLLSVDLADKLNRRPSSLSEEQTKTLKAFEKEQADAEELQKRQSGPQKGYLKSSKFFLVENEQQLKEELRRQGGKPPQR